VVYLKFKAEVTEKQITSFHNAAWIWKETLQIIVQSFTVTPLFRKQLKGGI
jgi:hypothetical protein